MQEQVYELLVDLAKNLDVLVHDWRLQGPMDADELSHHLQCTLIDVRLALCWDASPG
jgi:hypothetical protein